MKFQDNIKIIKLSLLCSFLTLLISFISNMISKNLSNDFLVLKLFSFPANFAILFAYFSGNTAFYFICFMELIGFFIIFITVFYFLKLAKTKSNVKL